MIDPSQHLGLAPNENRLVPYDAAWPQIFGEECAQLQLALGGLVVEIQHIGSTAVPGMHAKPIIDILVGVPQLSSWAGCQEALEARGYDYAPHAGLPGPHVFGRPRDRQFLLHVVEHRSEYWTRPLAFRDQLRENESARREYERAKLEAARECPIGRAAYNEKKHPVIVELMRRI
jgi:GrpB-like predicted nucleotidyltransferase (UPF0157 family)